MPEPIEATPVEPQEAPADGQEKLDNTLNDLIVVLGGACDDDGTVTDPGLVHVLAEIATQLALIHGALKPLEGWLKMGNVASAAGSVFSGFRKKAGKAG